MYSYMLGVPPFLLFKTQTHQAFPTRSDQDLSEILTMREQNPTQACGAMEGVRNHPEENGRFITELQTS